MGQGCAQGQYESMFRVSGRVRIAGTNRKMAECVIRAKQCCLFTSPAVSHVERLRCTTLPPFVFQLSLYRSAKVPSPKGLVVAGTSS